MNKGRKSTGGRYIANRKKKQYELPGQKRIVKLGDEKRKTKRTRSGAQKVFLLQAKKINVRTNGKTVVTEVEKVLETPSDRFLARQNIITKGTLVQTKLGKVKVTSRPSQIGILNGVIVQ